MYFFKVVQRKVFAWLKTKNNRARLFKSAKFSTFIKKAMQDFIDIFPSVALRINSRYFIFAGCSFLLFYVLLKNKLQSRKIQDDFPAKTEYRREIIFSLISMSIFALIATFIFSVARPYTFLYQDINQYGYPYFFLSIGLMVLIHDAYFYWMHRLMHHPFLYRKIHLIHHRSTNPSPWTAYAFHPIEAVIEAGILVLIVFVLPCHVMALISFFLFQIMYNVYGHLGYELYPAKLNQHKWGKWLNTSVAHNQHHHHFEGNYGLYFTFWDRLMGTLRADYDRACTNAKKNEPK